MGHTAEHRAAISAAQRERARRVAADQPMVAEGTKRCNGPCGRTKRWALDDPTSEFTVERHRGVSGIETAHPYSLCKPCQAERVRKRRQKDPERYRIGRRAYLAGIRADPLRGRRERLRSALWKRRQRRARGIPPLRYKDPARQRQADFMEMLASMITHEAWEAWQDAEDAAPQLRVPVRPFMGWMNEWLAATGTSRQQLVDQLPEDRREAAARALYRWTEPDADGKGGEGQERGSLWTMDELAVAMGMPDQLAVLYYSELDERGSLAS